MINEAGLQQPCINEMWMYISRKSPTSLDLWQHSWEPVQPLTVSFIKKESIKSALKRWNLFHLGVKGQILIKDKSQIPYCGAGVNQSFYIIRSCVFKMFSAQHYNFFFVWV